MNKSATFSVIIPTYNRQDLLSRALDSLASQTVKADEILVIDNGESRYCLNSYAENIKVILAPIRSGASQARNIGLSLASSDYVAFLDDDDYWDQCYIENMKKIVGSDSEKKLFIAALYDSVTLRKIEGKNDIREFDLVSMIRRNPGIVGSNIFAKKKDILELGGFDVNLPASEDVDLAIKAINASYILIGASDCIVFYDSSHSKSRLSNIKNLFFGKKILIRKYIKSWPLRKLLEADYILRLFWAWTRK